MSKSSFEYDVTVTFKLLMGIKSRRVLYVFTRPLALVLLALFAVWLYTELGVYAIISVVCYFLLIVGMLVASVLYLLHQARVVGGKKIVIQHQKITPDKIVVSVPGRLEVSIDRDKVKKIRYMDKYLNFRYVRYWTLLPLPENNTDKAIAKLKELGWE